MTDTVQQYCQFCPHAFHGTDKCSAEKCRCEGTAKWWQKLASGLGNAIGESLFGGNR